MTVGIRLVGAVAIVVLGAVTVPTVAAGQESGDPEKGRAVFAADCAMCHGSGADGMMGMQPSLRGAIERLSREGVEVAIRQRRRTQPPMPAWEDRLSDGEIDDVIAYIATLPDGPRNFGADGGSGMMTGGDGDGMTRTTPRPARCARSGGCRAHQLDSDTAGSVAAAGARPALRRRRGVPRGVPAASRRPTATRSGVRPVPIEEADI